MKQLKHLRQTLWRTLLCLTVAITCLSSASAANFNKDAKLYFKISNSDWKLDSAWFVANFNNNNTLGGTRVKLNNVEGDYYSCTVPNDFSHVELLRMNPSEDINANAWNYSNNFSQAPNGNNCLELASTGWSSINLSWTTYNNGGDVTTEYDYYFKRSRDWTNPEKLEFTDGKATLTRNMNANGQFGISVCTKGTTDQIADGWYAKSDTQVVEAGTHTYPLVNSNTHNFTLPNKGGNYTFEITLDENNLPKDITITTPEIEVALPDLYLGGDWISGCGTDIDKNLVQISANNGVYTPYTFKVSEANKMFRFYTQTSPVKNTDWMGPTGDKTLSDAEMNGTSELSASTSLNVFKLPKAGTYTISVKEYNATSKTVKFTISYTEPEKHLYLGATFKGNIEDPNFQLDNGNNKFAKVRFTKYGNDGNVMFRFANAFDRNNWIGPSGNEDIYLSSTNSTGSYTTSSSTSLSVYNVKNNGVYELEVLSWNNNEVKFKLNFIEEVEEGTPFYFVGDMNDWYSLEFEDPNAETSVNMGKFMNERDAWRFRKVKANDANLPDGVDTDWYVFDGFPDKQLSGQFQITSGGTNIWNAAEVYGHGTALNSGNLFEQGHGSIKAYHKNRVIDEMITDGIKFSAKGFGIQKRSSKEGSFPNFHMECNAVADAKIYFKPGDNPDMIITGRPRHFFVFYANTKNERGDDTIFAKINEGKPNTNNYFLPGIKFGDQRIPFYTENTCGNAENKSHMYSDEGIELNKVDAFKVGEHGNEADVRGCLKKVGLDDVIVDEIINNSKLPNGRLVDSFEHLYVARIPAGFENPAGWKYTLSLPKALSSDDREKPVAIACNHIYFMPTINGVSVHVNDDNFMSDKYYVELEEGVKTPMSEFDVQYYYRVYYSKPAEDGNSYEIRVVEHMPGNIIEEEYIAYRSGIDTRKPTLQETGRKLEFGWKPLNAHTSPEAVNATITEEQWAAGEKGWDIKEGNLSGIQDEESKWHVCWVESTDRMRRQRIPKELSNAYIQILACYFKKDNPDNPRRKVARAVDGEEIPTIQAPDMAVALDKADHVSIEPGELSFDNDIYHHPLQGNHLYYVLDNNAAVWTGIESIEDDFIGNTVEGDVNAAPVYYNLQGVRVAEPTKGIFIEVRGNKSRKVAY